MAEIVNQNPQSTEIQSPLIAGLSEGLNKISKVLNLTTNTITDKQIYPITADDTEKNKNKIYAVDEDFRLWLKSPNVVIKKNGIEISQADVVYTIDYIGGSVTFDKNLLDSDKITVSATYIKSDSTTINTITNLLNQVKNNKVDKEEGKGLSANDFTTAEKDKLASLEVIPDGDKIAYGDGVKY